MATVTASVVLQNVSTLSGYSTTGSNSGVYPSATSGSAGYDTVTAASGDTVVISIYSAVVSGYAVNVTKVPGSNNLTGGTKGSVSAISGYGSTAVTTMTFTGVTTSCNISIWCQPAVGNTSNGYRARVALTIQASTPAPTSITTNYATTSSPTTSVTVTSNGGSGTASVSMNNSTFYNSPYTFTNISRGTTYTFYAKNTSGGVDSTVFTKTEAAPYLPFSDNTITIGSYPSTITSNSDVSIPFSGGGSPDNYRIRSNNTTGSSWLNTQNGPSGTFVLEAMSTQTNYPEIPTTAGQTFTYFFEGQRRTNQGGDPNAGWASVNSGATISITRGTGVSYTITAPASINEGSQGTISVSTSGVSNGTTLYWNVTTPSTGDFSTSSGSVTINNNAGTIYVTPDADTTTEGTETATINLRTGSTSGTIVATDTFDIGDTSTFGGTTGGGGSIGGSGSNLYGLEIRNVNATSTIIDNTSRLGTFIGSASTPTLSTPGQSVQLFTSSSNGGAINCSDSTIIGIMATYDAQNGWFFPTITRNATTGITITRSNTTFSGATGVCTVYLIRY